MPPCPKTQWWVYGIVFLVTLFALVSAIFIQTIDTTVPGDAPVLQGTEVDTNYTFDNAWSEFEAVHDHNINTMKDTLVGNSEISTLGTIGPAADNTIGTANDVAETAYDAKVLACQNNLETYQQWSKVTSITCGVIMGLVILLFILPSVNYGADAKFFILLAVLLVFALAGCIGGELMSQDFVAPETADTTVGDLPGVGDGVLPVVGDGVLPVDGAQEAADVTDGKFQIENNNWNAETAENIRTIDALKQQFYTEGIAGPVAPVDEMAKVPVDPGTVDTVPVSFKDCKLLVLIGTIIPFLSILIGWIVWQCNRGKDQDGSQGEPINISDYQEGLSDYAIPKQVAAPAFSADDDWSLRPLSPLQELHAAEGARPQTGDSMMMGLGKKTNDSFVSGRRLAETTIRETMPSDKTILTGGFIAFVVLAFVLYFLRSYRRKQAKKNMPSFRLDTVLVLQSQGTTQEI